MAKKPKIKAPSGRALKTQRKKLLIFLTFLTLAKVFWLWNQPKHIIFSADTENYFNALEGLVTDGLFSKATNLHYWPAGYPILMWPIAELSRNYFPFIIGVIQSALFSYSLFYFSTQLQRTTLNKLFWPVVLIISLNPTLALNAPAIGYEVNVATCFVIALGAFLKFSIRSEKKLKHHEIWLAAASLSLATFMQPRISLLAFAFFCIWAIATFKRSIAVVMVLSTSLVVALGPLLMIGRNVAANNFVAISTNLGITMNIGAGPQSTGGYTNKATGVPCSNISGNPAKQDSHRVRCVLSWYRDNPKQAVSLFIHKFQYHWSPWFGPLANGTTARSQWLRLHPLNSSVQTQDGVNIVYGNVGKLISWGWIISSLGLMFYGFWAFWRLGGVAQVLSTLLFIPSMLNALSSMLTIGDNRFRIPTMTLSLILQLFGGYALLASRRMNKWTQMKQESTWVGLNWKKNSEKDSLRA
jgi:hypothetical protein